MFFAGANTAAVLLVLPFQFVCHHVVPSGFLPQHSLINSPSVAIVTHARNKTFNDKIHDLQVVDLRQDGPFVGPRYEAGISSWT
jgi:hypothetical protein